MKKRRWPIATMWTEVTDINSHRLQGLSKSKAFIISVTTTECFRDVVCNSKNPFEWPPCWTTAKSNLGKEDWISIHWECIVMHGRQINWMFACSPCSRLLRSLSDPAVDVTVGDTSGRPPWVWGSLEMRNLKTAETEEFVVCMPEKASVSFSHPSHLSFVRSITTSSLALHDLCGCSTNLWTITKLCHKIILHLSQMMSCQQGWNGEVLYRRCLSVLSLPQCS